VGHLVGILDDFGFAPEERLDDGQRSIGLRQCPFLDLVDTNARVICPVHLGLMQGVLGSLGAAVTVERLDPFVEPDLCLARLGPAARRE
jgi:predicted ArsR family transcriptional regulator